MYKGFEFWKSEGLAAVGLNQQRLGQPLEREESTGTSEQNMSASYSATEHLFTQYDDFLVRFHQMRTDLAQFYNSTNPSVSLQYTTSSAMKMWFRMDGRKLRGRDFGVSCVSTPRSRHVLEEIKKTMRKNNTTDFTGVDLMNIELTEDLADMKSLVKELTTKQQAAAQQKAQQEQQLQQQEEQHQMQLLQEKQKFDAEQKELDRQNALDVAQIQISPKQADAQNIESNTDELSQNMIQHNQKMDMDREKEINKNSIEKQKIDLGRQKLQSEDKRTQADIKNKQTELHIKNKASQQKKK
jgi:hypothetical protein